MSHDNSGPPMIVENVKWIEKHSSLHTQKLEKLEEFTSQNV